MGLVGGNPLGRTSARSLDCAASPFNNHFIGKFLALNVRVQGIDYITFVLAARR